MTVASCCAPWVIGLIVFFFLSSLASLSYAQSDATLRGRVLDSSGAPIPGASIDVQSDLSSFARTVWTDAGGWYQIAALPVGAYRITAAAPGFRTSVLPHVEIEVGRTLVHDFRLDVGDVTETVIVEATAPPIDRATSSVGHLVAATTVRDAPLNGRHFIDLGLLVAGSVTPSQSGFSTTPNRGQGALAFNTAGNREEAVGFLVNGVTTNNLAFGSLGFQPPISSVREFRMDNSTFSAQYGHVSGAIVNIATQSGSNTFHGDAFAFFRDDALDARNFFEFTFDQPHPFRRSQFGGSLGGPFLPDRGFFFVSYEGLRQKQGLDLNSLVLSDAQRSAVLDPVSRQLVALLPAANVVDAGGTPRFVGAAAAVVDNDRWTVDLQQNVGDADRVHLYYGRQQITTMEPGANGVSVPGFGARLDGPRGVLTVNETHVFGPALVNEARFGRSRFGGVILANAPLNPGDYGIRAGVVEPRGLPHITVAGGLVFGGPPNWRNGRDDTLYVLADVLSHVRGRHSIKIGGEYRHFVNHNFAEASGSFNFPTVDAFLLGVANAFTTTLGERRSLVDQRSLGLFVQDNVTVRSNLTFELGLRYEWHVTPTERDDRFVVFDSATASLRRVGADLNEVYRQNNRNLEPRLGIAWDPRGDGRTSVRAAFAVAVDQPSTTAVAGLAGNPPFAVPLSTSGAVRLDNALDAVRPVGLSPQTVDPRFANSSLQSWNVNLQREISPSLAAMIGYFGSRGRHLRLWRNINQPVDGMRPFPALSASSPLDAGRPLGNITQVEGTGRSSYEALWTSITKRASRGLQVDASYTWSRSLDYNSLNSSGFAIQDSYDLADQWGPSDFDARHRFVLSTTYELPPAGHALLRGWQLAAIVTSQSGNPVNIVTSNSTLTGTPNSVRPDRVKPIEVLGSVDQWFDTSAFVAVDRFGTLGRNVVTGPPFHNTDLSVSRRVRLTRRVSAQLRLDVFDLFNHPNFGQPGNVVGSPTFGKITRTRFPTGEAGSSRQIQLAAKVSF